MAKKIAFYISSLRKGGAERVIANLAEYFYKEGYKVIVVTTRRETVEYEIPEGITRRISEPQESELSGNRISNFMVRFKKLRGIWKEERPDVIVSFIGKNNFMAILTAGGLNIPVAVSVRGEPTEEYYNPQMRFMAKQLFKMAKGVILQTRSCLAFFPKKVQKKAVIMKNPLNPVFIKGRYEGEREKTIVAVGRVDENKNHRMLILAFAGIAQEFPDYKLIIYGDGEKRNELIALIKELDLQNQVLLPGSIDDVVNAIYKTRVFVLPSNTEGMPNTLIEAMSLGLTVVSTDCPCGGPAELIEDEVNGLLTPVNDSEKMKEKLQFLLNNLQKADFMGIQAAKAADVYKPEKVCMEWRIYLETLMKQ